MGLVYIKQKYTIIRDIKIENPVTLRLILESAPKSFLATKAPRHKVAPRISH